MVSPHGPISSQTVSRWLTDALIKAGVSPTYHDHSTRSASTSAVAEAGSPLELILKAAEIGHRLGLLEHSTRDLQVRELLHVLLFPCDYIHNYVLGIMFCC